MRIAHLSDVHVLDLTGVKRRQFLNKRISGLANVMGSRKAAHPTYLLEAAVAGLLEAPVDHVVITGDLSNLALDSEFRRAREILAPLADTGNLSVIPGNHDIYTRGSARKQRFEKWFGDLMWPEGTPADERVYPWFKDLGRIKIAGFNSARPRLPLMATGTVGKAQIQRLVETLGKTHDLKVGHTFALVHHNMHPRGWRKDRMHGLSDRDAFVDACATAGVRTILHGHTHVAHRFTSKGVEIIGCGSSTWASEHPSHRARYNVYTFDEANIMQTEVRIWQPAEKRFVPTTSVPIVEPAGII
ncbi:MAG: 3',5'-cyclic AMP phosphodiesterase CpdA [Myxococcota bacterium]|jgi:3',5'-cyclic AMP phosphodiesterase CpdA